MQSHLHRSHIEKGLAAVGATIPGSSVLFEFGNKPFIDQELWDRLVNRITKSEDIDILLAKRILNEALGFLRLCALPIVTIRLRR